MKKIYFLVTLLYISFSVNAQKVFSEVRYVFTINNEQSQAQIDCSLLYSAQQKMSTYVNFGFLTVPDSTYTNNREENGDQFINIEKYSDSDGQKPEYQKYYDKDSLYAFENVYGERLCHIVTEKLPHFNWVIEKDTRTILGHTAQKATTSFRGRDYEAWFAQDIPIPDGPYKFHGLPGLILEISSKDGKYKYLAYELKINKTSNDFKIEKLKLKYKKNRQVTIKQKLAIIKANEETEMRYQRSKNPNISEFVINNSGIEIDFKDI